jgi:small subunit ribosomal protein S20
MANNKSAKKRILISKRNTLQNRFYKSSVRTLTKKLLKDLEIYKDSQSDNDKQKVRIGLNSVYSLIDKGSKKSIYHKSTAARKKSRLAILLKNANVDTYTKA